MQKRVYYEKLISIFCLRKRYCLSFSAFYIADKCLPSISVQKMTAIGGKKLTTQISILNHA